MRATFFDGLKIVYGKWVGMDFCACYYLNNKFILIDIIIFMSFFIDISNNINKK